MMRRLFLIIALLAPAACRDPRAGLLTRFFNTNKAAVFVFLAPDCPLSQSYTPTLNALNEQFQSNGVAFYAVFSGKAAEAKAMKEFVETYHIQSTTVQD